MRFMLLVKATPESEAGILPDAAAFAEMGAFNETMLKAGVMLAADGLQPSSKGARVSFAGGKPSVTDGPFTETTELVAGFWIISAKSTEEAIAWVSRAPFTHGVVEVQPIYEFSDVPDDLITPEHRERKAAMLKETERRG